MCSGLVDHLGAIAGRMACILAAALLACASSAHAQVIEEGGFPVKGNGVSGEPFSLSCPPRLYVEAGESVLLSCSATAVPEEGVGYEWESLSGNGLHLLSDANERSPLFTAPLSGEGAEYVYRLTAMSVGVYETASVTVAIGGVSGGSVQGRGKSPVALEDCDTFGALEEIGEGCVAEDKAPSPFEPFEGGPEAESGSGFLFPEPFGVPEKGFSGFARDGAADMEIAPVLECPSAIFLEELETGSIECHAWDASGEEYLDFAWEPVGSTTRDYLDNPRLIPEDAPTASVVAPEAPRYERLEDARSGEASAVYRYRLTAMSRVTGLSSSAEVEVYVSGNRPSVYCPSEVVVEEGASIVLGCEGVDPLSYRLDYNEASASIAWAWAGLWETGTDPLSSTEAASPVFEAPAGSAGEEYHYIASMMSSASGEPRTARRRVTVRVVGEADVSGRMNDFITFPGNPFTVNEGQRISFYYQRSHPPGGSATGITPVNSVPIIVYSVSYGDGREALFFYATDKTVSGHAPCVDANTTYEYKVCVVATGTAFGIQRSCSEDEQVVYASTQISITILDTGNPICIPVASLDCRNSSVYEGHGDLVLRCSVTNEPSGATYSWTGTDIANRLSSTTVLRPTFRVPDNVDSKTTYSYKVTMSADGVDDVTEDVTVTVYNRGTLDVACTPPPLVYEGSADVAFDCSASGTPSGYAYTYSWRARGATSGTSLLSRTDIASPVFDVPDEVDETTTYEYLLTVSAANAKDAKAEVTVTVLNRGSLSVACAAPGSVYEGSADVGFDCSASGAPSGSAYTHSWRALGATSGTSLLSRTDIASPVFDVPDEVDETTTYEYLLTVSAANAKDAKAEVTVTVLNRGALSVVCADPGSVYEGSADVGFDCSASGAPSGSAYTHSWRALGATSGTSLLSRTDIASPVFDVPDEVDETTTYEYLLIVSAANTKDAKAEVTVTVLNRGSLSVVCADPGAVYEGSADITLVCSASGAPSGSSYSYAWTARGSTANTGQLSATDIASPVFDVPDEVDETTTYEYLLTVSAANAEDASAEVTVTVLKKEALSVVCTDPGEVYEGSEDITLACSASGAPEGSVYEYAWTARGSTANMALLSATDGPDPTFYVPDEVSEDETYEYLLTVSSANAESATAEVTVTVLNKEALTLACTDPGSVYEGSADITLDCTASGAPGGRSASGAPAGSNYTYAWTAQGSTANMALLTGTDGPAPTFLVPDEVSEDETYEYLLTVSAANAEDAVAEVTVTVLNKEALALACTDPGSVYEGSADITLDCSASGAPGDDPVYTYTWTGWGSTANTDLLTGTDGPAPTFLVPDEVDSDETYEYLLTVSAANAEDATAEVTVTVLNKEALALACTYPGSVYEGTPDITLDCSASGAPEGSDYEYAWTARGGTGDTDLLSATDIASPTFYVPDEVSEDETYEYLLTVSADNAEEATEEVSVTVLNKGALAIVCADPGSAYEGSEDIAFDCEASGAPGADPQYTYSWTARGDTQDTDLLSATDIASPTFYVPDEVSEDETYEYLLTVSAANAEDATAEVTVTVLDRVLPPVADATSPEAASSLSPEAAEASSLGVTASASPLRFGVQSADTQMSLDPLTDGISTRVSGPYHAGRMTLSLDGSEEVRENGAMDLSIELASPVVLRRKRGVEASSIVLAPLWSLSESCEQLSSEAIGSLYTETTLADGDCRLLRFGGELDLTGVPSGRYAGSMDIILRSGENEETHSVEVDVTVVPAQRVITIGPRGVRFSTSRELPAGLTEEQNLSIYPDVAFMTRDKPHGVFELSNPSLVPLEVTVSARFGYTEATENGREVVVEDASGSRLGDLSSVVDIYPGVLILMSGEKGLVRYGVGEGALAAMAERGYAAFFDVVSEPRQYVRSDQMPEEVSGERTARVTMRVPGVYIPGEGASQLRATLLSISFVGSLSATFLLETEDHPFAGEVVAYDGDGRELGRRETLVYTRSRVRVPLDRMPEEGAVFLRFAPRGSGRVPEPASVEWDAPRRGIGAAEDKDRATTTETLVQKP